MINKFFAYRGVVISKLHSLDWLPALVARLTIAAVFVVSGYGKLQNLDKVTEYFVSLGIPFASVQAPFVAGTELVCGSLVLIGFLTRLAAIPLIGTMTVALITAKAEEIANWDDIFGFIEYLYIVILIYLIFYGAGKLSFDHFIVKKWNQPGR